MNSAAAAIDGSIVDQDVGVAELVPDLPEQLGHSGSVRDVSRDRERLYLGVDLVHFVLDLLQLVGACSH